MCINSARYHKDKESPFGIIFSCCMSIISQIYPIAALVLFVVVSYASSKDYSLIEKNLNLLRKQKTDEHYFRRLLALKGYHALACESTDHINNCFGCIMIVSIPFHFVAIITTSFFFIWSGRGADNNFRNNVICCACITSFDRMLCGKPHPRPGTETVSKCSAAQ